jgi:transcriptional regulator GlxA family with amidase domain
MNITFVLYDEMTALDLVGPYQVLVNLPQTELRLAAVSPGPKRTDTGMIITADRALAELSDCEIVVVPGSGHPQAAASDESLLAWLRGAASRARWLCSVCTGSLILGAAGLLRGRRATTHWLVLDALKEYGALPVAERVVRDERIVTAAGVSAGIDMALQLVSWLHGPQLAQTVQLMMEYDPQPPYDAGSPRTASAEVLAAATAVFSEQLARAR